MSRARVTPLTPAPAVRALGALLARAAPVLACAAAACALTACGKKGPPSPPIHILPAAARGVSVRQIGPAVEVSASLSLIRSDGTPLGEGAEVRVLRLPTTETLRPEAVSPRYLLRQFEKGASVVARLSGAGLAGAAPGNRLRVLDSGGAVAPHPGKPARLLYGVLVVDTTGERSPMYPPVPIEILEAPGTPVDLKGEVAEGEVRLTWSPGGEGATPTAGAAPSSGSTPAAGASPVTGATSSSGSTPAAAGKPPAALLFNVYRKGAQESADPEAPLNAKPVTSSSYVDTTFHYGEIYRYFVRRLSQAGAPRHESEDSAVLEIRPLDRFPPSVPTGLAATAEGTIIKVYWFPNAEPDLGGYRVYRRETLDAPPMPIGEVGPNETSFVDSQARAGVRYYYSVAAFDQASPRNESAPSEEKSDMLSADVARPAPPSGMPPEPVTPQPEKPR